MTALAIGSFPCRERQLFVNTRIFDDTPLSGIINDVLGTAIVVHAKCEAILLPSLNAGHENGAFV
jgi:hypothetical protein